MQKNFPRSICTGPSKRQGWRKRTQLGLCAESGLEIFTIHATKVVLSVYGSVKTQAKVTSKKTKPEYVMRCTGSPADAPTELLPLQIKLYAYYALPVRLAARLCVCLSVCLSVYLYSRTAGNEAARERYTRVQRNKRSNNNLADLAETAAFWQEIPAQPWTTFCDPAHQLARCACVFKLASSAAPGRSSTAWSSALLYYATSSATSLFQNRCIRYQGI